MSSWLATRDSYHPAWTLAAGLLTVCGAFGTGASLLRWLRLHLPRPWHCVTSTLLGLQVFALATELLGMAGAASRSGLALLLGLFWLGGTGATAWRLAVIDRARTTRKPWSVPERLAALLPAIALAINGIVALAPSTKIDELYYHMLVPARLVHDQTLQFYLLPWEGATVPQMGYQISLAVLHAIRLPDAGNVVSWSLSVMLSWLTYRILRLTDGSRMWAQLWTAVVTVGLYGTVWHVTGGSHAMGELAMMALTVGVLAPENVWGETRAEERAAVIGILAAAGCMSKLSTTPLALVLAAGGLIVLCRGRTSRQRLILVAVTVTPVAVFLLPAAIWTWRHSGAPLGPFLSDIFPSSVYRGTNISASVDLNEPLSVRDLVIRHSPLLWVGAIAALCLPAISRTRRALAALAVAGQIILIVALFSWDTRYLSGVPFGLAVVFALAIPADIRARVERSRLGRVIPYAAVVPWIILSIYYAGPFAAVVFGRESRERFLDRYVSFYFDYGKIDRLIPRDAVLLTNMRLSATYAPRAPYWTVRDLPAGKPVYQFSQSCDPIAPNMTGGRIIYYTPVARVNTFRTPGRPASLGPLCVRELTASQGMMPERNTSIRFR